MADQNEHSDFLQAAYGQRISNFHGEVWVGVHLKMILLVVPCSIVVEQAFRNAKEGDELSK